MKVPYASQNLLRFAVGAIPQFTSRPHMNTAAISVTLTTSESVPSTAQVCARSSPATPTAQSPSSTPSHQNLSHTTVSSNASKVISTSTFESLPPAHSDVVDDLGTDTKRPNVVSHSLQGCEEHNPDQSSVSTGNVTIGASTSIALELATTAGLEGLSKVTSGSTLILRNNIRHLLDDYLRLYNRHAQHGNNQEENRTRFLKEGYGKRRHPFTEMDQSCSLLHDRVVDFENLASEGPQQESEASLALSERRKKRMRAKENNLAKKRDPVLLKEIYKLSLGEFEANLAKVEDLRKEMRALNSDAQPKYALLGYKDVQATLITNRKSNAANATVPSVVEDEEGFEVLDIGEIPIEAPVTTKAGRSSRKRRTNSSSATARESQGEALVAKLKPIKRTIQMAGIEVHLAGESSTGAKAKRQKKSVKSPVVQVADSTPRNTRSQTKRSYAIMDEAIRPTEKLSPGQSSGFNKRQKTDSSSAVCVKDGIKDKPTGTVMSSSLSEISVTSTPSIWSDPPVVAAPRLPKTTSPKTASPSFLQSFSVSKRVLKNAVGAAARAIRSSSNETTSPEGPTTRSKTVNLRKKTAVTKPLLTKPAGVTKPSPRAKKLQELQRQMQEAGPGTWYFDDNEEFGKAQARASFATSSVRDEPITVVPAAAPPAHLKGAAPRIVNQKFKWSAIKDTVLSDESGMTTPQKIWEKQQKEKKGL